MIKKFRIEAKSGEHWKTVYTGSTIGMNKVIKFKRPITTDSIRLVIIKANQAPSIGFIATGK